jgi:hypothetical protein
MRVVVLPGGAQPAGASLLGRRDPMYLGTEMKDLANDDLIRQEGVTVGQVENGLLGQLFGVIRPRTSLKDDRIVRADDVQVANSTAGPAFDVSFDALREFLTRLAPGESPWFLPTVMRVHATLPRHRRCDWTIR